MEGIAAPVVDDELRTPPLGGKQLCKGQISKRHVQQIASDLVLCVYKGILVFNTSMRSGSSGIRYVAGDPSALSNMHPPAF